MKATTPVAQVATRAGREADKGPEDLKHRGTTIRPARTQKSPLEELRHLVSLARQSGEADAYTGKRRWVRYARAMRLEVTTDPADRATLWPVIMHNVSGGGLGFWSKHCLKEGTRIFVRRWSEAEPRPWLPARVTHCTIGIAGHLVGAALDSPAPPDLEASESTSSRAGHSDRQRRRGFPATLLKSRSLRTRCAVAAGGAAGVGLMLAGVLPRYAGPAGSAFWVPLAGALATCLVGGLMGWAMVGGEARFLAALAGAVRRMAGGSVSRPTLGDAPSRELVFIRNALLDLGANWQQREDTERLQRVKLEELNQIKSNILSVVSHELRTPLTSILLYAKMLTDELETLAAQDQQRFLSIISEECVRLARLVDDLLDLQRLESGRVRWDMRPQDLAATIQSCARLFHAMALSKSIRFTVDCPETLPPVEADSDKIAQVVSNLLSNAMKYTPAGGAVQLAAEASGQDILVRVSDDGPGIPREKWDQIFDRFTQLNQSRSNPVAGVGLGLYIVRQLVERHGGAVWVDSEPGRGSTFTVSLPARTESPKADAEVNDAAATRRVLVCDADPELAAMIAQTLRFRNLEVRVAHSACRLLAQLEQGDIHVVVTDVLLPDMDAAELLEALTAKRRRPYRLIVHSYASDGPELRRRGADILLRRPASREELVQAVRVAIQKHSAFGRTILLLDSVDVDVRRFKALLSDAGHLPIVVESVEAAGALLRDYPVDFLLLSGRRLDGDWAKLQDLRRAADDNTRSVVLCENVRKKDRLLAEGFGVSVLPYRPGTEEEVLAALLADHKPAAAEPVT